MARATVFVSLPIFVGRGDKVPVAWKKERPGVAPGPFERKTMLRESYCRTVQFALVVSSAMRPVVVGATPPVLKHRTPLASPPKPRTPV